MHCIYKHFLQTKKDLSNCRQDVKKFIKEKNIRDEIEKNKCQLIEH